MAKTFRDLLQQIDALMNAREMAEKTNAGFWGLRGRFSSESAKLTEIALKCAISV